MITLSTFIPLISSVIAILTFWLAFRIYKNLDVRKNIVKLQVETVFELTNKLEKNVWIVEVNSEPKQRFGTWLLTIANLQLILQHEDLKELKGSDNFYLSIPVLWEMEILKYIEHPFIPKSIADNLEMLRPISSISYFDVEENESIKVYQKTNAEQFTKGSDIEVKDSTFITMENYFLTVWEIKKSIDKWLSQFNVRELNTFRKSRYSHN